MKSNFIFLAIIILAGLFVLNCSSGSTSSGRGEQSDDDTSPGYLDDDIVDDDTSDDDDAGDDDTADDDAANDDSADDDASGNLTWQDPPSSDYITWEEAKAYCDNLSFDGHDDWRLPTISELRNLIRGCDGTMTGGACNVTDDCRVLSCWNDPCNGCDSLAGPGSGGAYWPDGMSGEITWYWSSSPLEDIYDHNWAWPVNFDSGGIYILRVDGSHPARCVR